MSKEAKLDEDSRALLVLTREARRVEEAAERVRLVVDAMALRRGLPVSDRRSPA